MTVNAPMAIKPYGLGILKIQRAELNSVVLLNFQLNRIGTQTQFEKHPSTTNWWLCI